MCMRNRFCYFLYIPVYTRHHRFLFVETKSTIQVFSLPTASIGICQHFIHSPVLRIKHPGKSMVSQFFCHPTCPIAKRQKHLLRFRIARIQICIPYTCINLMICIPGQPSAQPIKSLKINIFHSSSPIIRCRGQIHLALSELIICPQEIRFPHMLMTIAVKSNQGAMPQILIFIRRISLNKIQLIYYIIYFVQKCCIPRHFVHHGNGRQIVSESTATQEFPTIIMFCVIDRNALTINFYPRIPSEWRQISIRFQRPDIIKIVILS